MSEPIIRTLHAHLGGRPEHAARELRARKPSMRVWLPGEPRLASRLVPQHGQTCRRDHAGDEEHSPHGLGHAHRPEVLAHGDGRGRRAATGQAVREAGVRASREAQGRAWRAWGCAPREEAMFVVHSALLYVACGTGSWYIVDQ